MFSRSLLCLFLAIAACLLLVSAAPSQVARASEAALEKRVEIDLHLKILLDLKKAIEESVKFLDGIINPAKAIAEIVAAFQAAAKALAALEGKFIFTAEQIAKYIKIGADIFITIGKALAKYGILTLITIASKVDAAFSAFLDVAIKVFGEAFKAGLRAAIKGFVDLLSAARLILSLAKIGITIKL